MSDPSPEHKSADDLLAEAMACVAWDGTVDMERLASIEFAHDEAATRRIVALAAASMDFPTRIAPSGGPDGIQIGGAGMRGKWEMVTFRATRGSGAWCIDALGGTVSMTDEHLALYGALCARHKCFSMTWPLSAHDIEQRRGRQKSAAEADWWLEWKDMWMSRVVGAIAAASGAWTGDELVRTPHLARALLDILRARVAGGPLASPAGGDTKEVPSEPVDASKATRLCKAIALVTDMSKVIGFVDKPLYPTTGTTHDPHSAVELLKFIINATQRIYETQPFYTAVIAPAEYEALCRNTPAGAFQ